MKFFVFLFHCVITSHLSALDFLKPNIWYVKSYEYRPSIVFKERCMSNNKNHHQGHTKTECSRISTLQMLPETGSSNNGQLAKTRVVYLPYEHCIHTVYSYQYSFPSSNVYVLTEGCSTVLKYALPQVVGRGYYQMALFQKYIFF